MNVLLQECKSYYSKGRISAVYEGLAYYIANLHFWSVQVDCT